MSSEASQQLSRRDWFRLRVPKPSNDLLGDDEQREMQPVGDPENHAGLDLADLPPVHEAVLTSEQISALFSDLNNLASNVQLLVRGASKGDTYSAQHLQITRDRLLAGDINKIQVRYEWEGARWIDTLEVVPTGFRIVRIKHA